MGILFEACQGRVLGWGLGFGVGVWGWGLGLSVQGLGFGALWVLGPAKIWA